MHGIYQLLYPTYYNNILPSSPLYQTAAVYCLNILYVNCFDWIMDDCAMCTYWLNGGVCFAKFTQLYHVIVQRYKPWLKLAK